MTPGAGKGRSEPKSEVVLLVEDDAFLRETLAEPLRAQGLEVIEAGDAPQALQVIRERSPAIDWLVTDYQLGPISGIHVAFEFRFQNATRPILFITARELPDDLRRMSGVVYLQKPFSPDDLVAAIAALRAGRDPPSAPGS